MYVESNIEAWLCNHCYSHYIGWAVQKENSVVSKNQGTETKGRGRKVG